MNVQIKNCDRETILVLETLDAKGQPTEREILPGEYAYTEVMDGVRLYAGRAAPIDKVRQRDERTPGQATYEAQLTAKGDVLVPWGDLPRDTADAWEAAAQAAFRLA